MNKILIINAHQPYPFSEGKLNQTLVDEAVEFFKKNDYEVKTVFSAKKFDVEEELAKHVWADTILIQAPVNWMGMPWSFKKYMDEVYTAGMSGALCNGDGRTSDNPTANYGAGGTATDKNYMLSLTFNAPKEAFNNPDEFLFEGKSVDDLMYPMHMNFRFFGMTKLPTFACYDVMKNPNIQADLQGFQKHLKQNF